MPKGISDLELIADSKNGTVTGEVMHGGEIESKNGCVNITLKAPLRVKASTENGEVSVNDMIPIGNDRYNLPEADKPKGTPSVDSKNGSVIVNYNP